MIDMSAFAKAAIAFLLAFVAAGGFALIFKAVYQAITPYREAKLIREGNTAAAIALAGALIGYILPVASALSNTSTLPEFVLWAAMAGVIQVVTFTVVRMIALPDVQARIESGEVSIGIYVATISVVVGIINAACMTA